MGLNIGTLKTINFPFETNGKLMALGVPILKHFRVSEARKICCQIHVTQVKPALISPVFHE